MRCYCCSIVFLLCSVGCHVFSVVVVEVFLCVSIVVLLCDVAFLLVVTRCLWYVEVSVCVYNVVILLCCYVAV